MVRASIRQRASLLKQHLLVPDIAHRLGLHPERRGGRGLWLACPRHADVTPSLWLHDDHFYCFSCQKGGSGIDLVMQARKVGIQEAIGWLEKAFGLGIHRGPDALRTRIEVERRLVQRRRDAAIPPSDLVGAFLQKMVEALWWYERVSIPSVRDHMAQVNDYVFGEIDDTVVKVERGEGRIGDLEAISRWAKGVCGTRFRIMMEAAAMEKEEDDGAIG